MKNLFLALLPLVASPAFAGDEAALILKKYDDLMAPPVAQMEASMIVTRDDGSQRTYFMRILKKNDDKSRVSFDKPASMAGQEILRVGDNAWIYLPDIKRATNMSSKDSFQGGDFSNADMLRPNLSADYIPAFAPEEPDAFVLDLTSKTKETAYHTIKLWLRKKDSLPIKAQYFATSGKLLRSTTYSDYKEFQPGYVRPAKLVMTNETVKNRQSELNLLKLKVGGDIPDARFVLSDLGK